jgi:hypothetical protein
MVPITALVLPIVLSAILVFVASSIIHMLLPIHRGDLRGVPAEDDVRQALGRAKIPPGDYAVPFAGSPAAMKDPAFIAKMTAGPVLFMTVRPAGPPTMASSLVQWFVYTLVVGVAAAYVAGRALAPGAQYLEVFRFAGTAAFLCYSMSLPQGSIWWKRSWSATVKTMIDGLVYGLLTGGAFGWLWPR